MSKVPPPPVICAVVVTYNAKCWREQCFGSLINSLIPMHIIVIDNCSSDDTVEYVKNKFPQIELITSKVNLGFAKANNIGIKRALELSAEYVFLLNQDAWIEKDTMEKLLISMRANPQVGIVSPVHLNGEKSNFDFMFCGYMPRHFFYDAWRGSCKANYTVDFVNAAAWLISAECIRKVGGFDTMLFVHYSEDVNYTQRVRYHGFQILVNTTSTICHDREERSLNEDVYRKKVFFDENRDRKCDIGNICYERDMKQMIHKQINHVIKCCLRLNFKEALRHKRDIMLLRQIQMSRTLNKEGGLVWLN